MFNLFVLFDFIENLHNLIQFKTFHFIRYRNTRSLIQNKYAGREIYFTECVFWLYNGFIRTVKNLKELVNGALNSPGCRDVEFANTEQVLENQRFFY